MVLAALDGDSDAAECVHWEKRDIVEEVRRAAGYFSLPARQKGVQLSFSANIRSFAMQTDAQMLRRIVENLAGNALKATPPGGKIEVRVIVRGDGVDLSVLDTGCGIPQKNLSLIMQPGYTTGGHGLGLSIAEKYARMLGGCICISSEENRGSSFVVHLPVRCEKTKV